MFSNISDFELQIITTFVVPNIALIPMVGMAMRKWHQSKQNVYNLVLSFFFLSFIIGLLFNTAYSLFVSQSQFSNFWIPSNLPLAFLFARLSAMVLNYSLVFPLYFLIVLEKSFKVMEKRYNILYFVLTFILVVPISCIGEVSLSEDFVLRWDAILAIYSTTYSVILITGIMVYSIRLLKEFQDVKMKRRFLAFIVGFIFIVLMLFAVVLVKLSIVSSGISAIFSVLAIFISPSLIYYGIATKST